MLNSKLITSAVFTLLTGALFCSHAQASTLICQGRFAPKSENSPAVLSTLKAQGIPVQIAKRSNQLVSNNRFPEDRYILDVKFGRITQAQFNTLKSYFGGLTQVTYSAQRSYELVDFLSPAMQAVNAKTFKPIGFSFDKVRPELDALAQDENHEDSFDAFALLKNGIGHCTNCWNTTIQMLRHNQLGLRELYSLGWVSRSVVTDTLISDDHSVSVASINAKPGDVLAIYAFEEAQHTAIVIGDGLVFEKTDSSEEDAYRIGLLSDVIHKYQNLLSDDDGLKFVVRRFGGANKTPPDGPYVGEPLSANLQTLINREFPEINVSELQMTAETGLGGGSDVGYSLAPNIRITIDPVTQRGVIQGTPELTERFQPIN